MQERESSGDVLNPTVVEYQALLSVVRSMVKGLEPPLTEEDMEALAYQAVEGIRDELARRRPESTGMPGEAVDEGP